MISGRSAAAPPGGWYSYDPKTNLVFYGTGNPGTWNPAQRPGDNKWSMTIMARDLDTGEAKLFQFFEEMMRKLGCYWVKINQPAPKILFVDRPVSSSS